MYTEDKTFILRFSLEAGFPADYEGEEDQYQWLGEWEGAMKREVLRVVLTVLRRYPGWTARVRNRGISERDEIEIVVSKDFGEAAADATS
jgi:hypothetical protein